MGDKKEVGHVIVRMFDDGSTSLDAENLSYMQLYGIAGVINGMALNQQQQIQLQEAIKSGKIDIARSLPSLPQ